MMSRLNPMIAALLLVSLASCASRQAENRHYVFHGDQSLSIDGVTQSFDTWNPKSPGLHPLVMLVHGGGWEKGRDFTDMRSIGDRLAEDGFFVLNVSYRFAPDAKFPDQLRDLVKFLIWADANKEELSIDTTRTALLGYSAGAHLALMLGYTPPNSVLAGSLPAGMRFRSVVAGGAPSDLSRFPDSPLVKQLIKGSENPESETYRKALADASPINWVTAAAPPTFLYHGKHDWVVDVEQSRALARKLRDVGVDVEFTEPTLGHIYNFVFDKSEIRAARKFIQRHLDSK